jgi:para-nitrobenzyl esterase
MVRTSFGIATGYQANDSLLFTPPIRSKKDFDDWVNSRYGSVAAEFLGLYPGGSLQQMQLSVTESNRDRVSMSCGPKRDSSTTTVPFTPTIFDRTIPWPQHPEFGAFHSGELPYFFRNLQLMDRPWQPIDYPVADTASAYLKAFATNGDPNAHPLPHWPAVNPALPLTMEIGAKVQPMPRWRAKHASNSG